MKKIMFIILIIASLLMISCNNSEQSVDENETEGKVMMISPEEAKENLDEDSEIVLLDVRTPGEYESGHIEDAVLLPLDQLNEKASEVIPDQEKTYYVYCRSGNRSATAAQLLVDMGYENIYDLGGIIDWPYDTVKE
jgi:rhodanese-related sulfurtransferase